MYVCIAEFGFPDSLADRESACNAGETSLILGLGRSPWRRHRLPSPAFLGFPGGSDGKESDGLQCGRPEFDLWVGKIL